jgi:hypothetical protein
MYINASDLWIPSFSPARKTLCEMCLVNELETNIWLQPARLVCSSSSQLYQIEYTKE